MEIRSLPEEIKTHIRSGLTISSFGHCVTELVLNSLDAKATAIAVRINLSKYKVQVVDNGKGISQYNMQFIGIKHMTNKCSSLNDLKKKYKYYGYRGESLASVTELSRKMFITSRLQGTDITCSKLFENNVEQDITVKQRPSNGTTITVEDLFYNQPVRQRRINSDIDIDEIKRYLESLSVIHPNVSFSFRNDVTGHIILNCHKTKSVAESFANLHCDIDAEHFREIKIMKDNISVSGLIYFQLFEKNKFQFIYVNKRPTHLAKIQKLMNNTIMKCNIGDSSENLKKQKYMHPIYIINIMCPYSELEIILNSTKCLAEFKSWNIVSKCIHKLLNNFKEKNWIHDDKHTQICNPLNEDSVNLFRENESPCTSNAKKRPSQMNRQSQSKILKVRNESEQNLLCDVSMKLKVKKKTLGISRRSNPRKIEKHSTKHVFEEPINTQCLSLDLKHENLFRINPDQHKTLAATRNKIGDMFEDDYIKDITLNDYVGESTKVVPLILEKNDKQNSMDVLHSQNNGKKYIMDAFIKSIDIFSSQKGNDINTDEEHNYSENNVDDEVGNLQINETLNIIPNMKSGKKLKCSEEVDILHDVSFVNTNLKKRRLEKINSVGNFIINNKLETVGQDPIETDNGILKMVSKCVQTTDEYISCNKILFNKIDKFHINNENENDVEQVRYNFELETKSTQTFVEYEGYSGHVSKYFEPPKVHCYKKRKQVNSFAELNNKSIDPFEMTFNNSPINDIRNKDNLFHYQNNVMYKEYKKEHRKCNSKVNQNYLKPTFCIQKNEKDLKEVTFESHYNMELKLKKADILHTNQNYSESVINNLFYKSIFFDINCDPEREKNYVEFKSSFKQKTNKNKINNITINSNVLANELSLFESNSNKQFPMFPPKSDCYDINYKKFEEDLNQKIYVGMPRSINEGNVNVGHLEIKQLKKNIESLGENLEQSVNVTFSKYFVNEKTFITPNKYAQYPKVHKRLSITHTDTSSFMQGSYVGTYKYERFSDQPVENLCYFIPQIKNEKTDFDNIMSQEENLNNGDKFQNNEGTYFHERTFATPNINDSCEASFIIDNIVTDVHEISCMPHVNYSLNIPKNDDIEQADVEINDLTFCNFCPHFKSTQNERECSQIKLNSITADDQSEQPNTNNEWTNQMDKYGNLFYLNTRTGMTSNINTLVNNHFTLKKRVDFIPKGFSPILETKKQYNTSMTPTSRKKLHSAIIETYQSELNTVKWEKYINEEDMNLNNANTFFDNIYNEKCKQYEAFVPDISKNSIPGHLKTIYDSYTFTKDVFIDLVIIGQMDCKFIVTISKSSVLILFDQHAVHERIRLEKLLQEYAGDGTTVKFQSMNCGWDINIKFLYQEMQILTNYRQVFENLGLVFDVLENEIVIRQIPTCIYKKCKKYGNDTYDILRKLIRTLINEEIEMIQTRCGLLSKIPDCLQNIVNSEACRGAIKFGEKLTHEECINYITELSKCNLPFQCAHGRPTLVPVLLIHDDDEVYKYKPNINNLFKS